MKRWVIGIAIAVAVGVVAASPTYSDERNDRAVVANGHQAQQGEILARYEQSKQGPSSQAKQGAPKKKAGDPQQKSGDPQKKASDPQKKGAPGDKAKAGRWMQVLKELNLSADQQEKIRAILEAESAKVRSLKQAAGQGDKAGLKEKMRQIREETIQQIRSVLTAEQRAKFDDLLKKRKEARAAKRAKRLFMRWLYGPAL